MSNIHALRQRKAEVVKQQRTLLDAAAKEARSLNETEAAQFDDNIKKLATLEENLVREERVLEMERSMSSLPDENARAAREAGIDNPAAGDQPGTRQARPFASLGEQLIAVARSSMGNYRQDPRLVKAAISGMGETPPADGGFLVHKDFSDLLLQRTYELGQIS